MKTIIALLVLAGTMWGQDTYYHIGDWQPSHLYPKNAREGALQAIQEYDDYTMTRNSYLVPASINDNAIVYEWKYGNDPNGWQSFKLSTDGKFTFENISAEDALLAVMGNKLRDSLNHMKREDAAEAERQKERDSIPPETLKSKKYTYKISSVPEFPGDVLAVTHCNTARIESLISDEHKRISIMHEMMHVATNCDPKVHTAIYELAAPLLKMLQDNPNMVDYLTNRKPVMMRKSHAAGTVPRKREGK
jgi:hypothetical protein